MDCSPGAVNIAIALRDELVKATKRIQRLEAKNASLNKVANRLQDAVDQWELVASSPGAVEDMARENTELLKKVEQLQTERDAAIHYMHEAQGIVCLICKNHYQPDPAVKRYGCKEFGEHYPEEGSLACGMFEWRGVQKEE